MNTRHLLKKTLLITLLAASHPPSSVSAATITPQFIGQPTVKGPYARNVWAMKFHDGRLFVASGNSSNDPPEANSGPVAVLYWDGFRFGGEVVLNEEQIERFILVDGKLIIPGHDTRDPSNKTSFYTRNDVTNTWVQTETLVNLPTPQGVVPVFHCYDIQKTGSLWWAGIGVNGSLPGSSSLCYSANQGLTWTLATPTNSNRTHELIQVGTSLYGAYTMPSSTTGRGFSMFRVTSSGTIQDQPHITKGRFAPGYSDPDSGKTRVYRNVLYGARTLYILGEGVNDHGTNPKGIFSATSWTSTAANATKINPPGGAAGYVPFDVLVEGGRVYVLWVRRNIQSATQESFTMLVASSADTLNWVEQFNFTLPTFARSFEKTGNTWYFGLGTDVGTTYNPASITYDLKADSGKVYRYIQP
jgi:hypothetical protein